MDLLVLIGYISLSIGIFIIFFNIILILISFIINKKNKYDKFTLYDKPFNKETNNWDLFEYTIYILKYEYPAHKTCNLKVDLGDKDKFVPIYYNDDTKKIIYNKIEKYYNLISHLILDKIFKVNEKYNAHYDIHIKKALMLHCFHIAHKYNLTLKELIDNIDNIFENININHFTIFYMFNFSNILYNQFWTIPRNDDGWKQIYLNI